MVTQTQPLKIYIDGELVADEPEQQTPTKADYLRASLKLELKMLAYDLRYRTHYRQIRHELVREARDKTFEQSIGLVRDKKIEQKLKNGSRLTCERCGKTLTGHRTRWCSDTCSKSK
jgi:hypothetical protein